MAAGLSGSNQTTTPPSYSLSTATGSRPATVEDDGEENHAQREQPPAYTPLVRHPRSATDIAPPTNSQETLPSYTSEVVANQSRTGSHYHANQTNAVAEDVTIQAPKLAYTVPRDRFEIVEPIRQPQPRVQPLQQQQQQNNAAANPPLRRTGPVTHSQLRRLRLACILWTLIMSLTLGPVLWLFLSPPRENYCTVLFHSFMHYVTLVMAVIWPIYSIEAFALVRNTALQDRWHTFYGPGWWYGPLCAVVYVVCGATIGGVMASLYC